jgi:hypothetical protein
LAILARIPEKGAKLRQDHLQSGYGDTRTQHAIEVQLPSLKVLQDGLLNVHRFSPCGYL